MLIPNENRIGSIPSGSEAESLWDCLHDGELISCRSDLIKRVITLEFNVRHLLEEPDSDLRFFLRMHNVESVRAAVYFRWPGEFFVPEGASREEECRLIDEYQTKWREESVGWLHFEGALSTDPLQIPDADLIQSDSKVKQSVACTAGFPASSRCAFRSMNTWPSSPKKLGPGIQ